MNLIAVNQFNGYIFAVVARRHDAFHGKRHELDFSSPKFKEVCDEICKIFSSLALCFLLNAKWVLAQTNFWQQTNGPLG